MQLDNHALPKRWNDLAGSRAARNIGDGWLASGASLALIVPSVLTQYENNVLINPEHPDLQKRLKTVQNWLYSFDQGLAK